MHLAARRSRYATLMSLLLAVFGVFLASAPAYASTNSMTWNLLESNGCGGGCITGPFGTVSVTESAANTLHFDVNLLSTYQFVGGAGAFGFNIFGGPTLAFANFAPPFDDHGGNPASDDDGFKAGNTVAGNINVGGGFGKFMYTIIGGGGGGGNPQGQTLQFDITATGLVLASLVTNAAGNLFVADICALDGCGSGFTGYAGGGTLTAVPVPAALPLLGAGLGLMAFIGRRKKFKATAR